MSEPSVTVKLSSPKFTAMNYTLVEPSLSFLLEKGLFTLKESGGSWNGIPIKASGTVGPIFSAAPAVNMAVRLAFKSETLTESLKPIVPDIQTYNLKDYKLKGTIEIGVKITGKLPSLKLNLSVSSATLSALDSVTLKELNITAALSGSAERFDLKAHAASMAAAGIMLQSPSLSVTRNGRQIRITDVAAKSGEGSITGGGTVTMAQSGAGTIDMALSLNRLDLTSLAKSGGFSLAGVLTGKVALSGAAENPNISFSGNVPRLTALGVTIDGVTADVSGNAKTLKINSLKANVGGAPLSAAGNVNLAPFGANIDVTGSNLDLAVLTAEMPDLKGQASGKFDLKFNVKGSANGTYGGLGSLTSPALTLYGMKLSNIILPVSLSNTAFKSEGGSLAFYGGKAANTFSLDLGTMKFNDTLSVTGADVNTLAQDASGGLNGKITGRGNLSMKLNGTLSPKLTYSGSGEFTMGEGTISGFSGLDLLTKIHGVNGIRYTKVTAPLRIDMAKLTVIKGASAVPPANDPLYRSAALIEDGSVTLGAAKKLYFLADLSINFQLLNALTGGAAGGADALIKGGSDIGKNLEDILKGAVNTGVERGKDADFRNVTVKVTGTSEKPAYTVVKIGSSAKQEQVPQTPQTPQKPTQPATQPSIPRSPAPAAETPATEKPSVEEKVREEINKQFQKGLEGLFK
jgi:autotransporter translocation and assembly factor TamB